MHINRIENVNYSNYKYDNKPTFKRSWQEHMSWGANYLKETGKTDFKLFSFPDAKAVFVEIGNECAAGLSNIKDRIVQLLYTVTGSGILLDKAITKDKNSNIYRMENCGDGIFAVNDVPTEINDKYRFIIIKNDYDVNIVKDPYSKKQENIHGWSSIYDKNNYKWENTDWIEGKDSRRITRNKKEELRGLEHLIINEVNIPSLSEEGTFDAAIKQIDNIAETGIATAIELMPVENTYSLQWGYDGVDKFAVNEKMGGALKLKKLIDYAHGKGLNVIMDMVPNHIGPDGDYLTQAGPYERGAGQFGGEFNYEGINNKYVRDYMVNAALWWANEFKVDGLRLDMTKMCGSDYLLKQIVSEINEHNPKVFTIAEDARENKESVTRYERNKPNHDEELKLIDMSVDMITNYGWSTTPQNIGFDSEWDFRFMHTLKNAIIGGTNLDALDDRIKNSAYRVKYVMSHDEIGNEDGTRLIPKIICRELDLYNKVNGYNDSEKGQQAAQASQKLAMLIISKDFAKVADDELENIEKSMGLNTYIDKKTLINVFNKATAKQKLAFGTVMTIPGPKMFFQGDDSADLAQFKFFREFSNEKEERSKSDKIKNDILVQKGYDTLESIARKDCIVDKIKPAGMFKNYGNKIQNFYKSLIDIMNSNPALLKGNIIGTYNDYNHNVHIHHLSKDGNEILVIKNFGQGFHDKSYGYYGFPQEGVWTEILSSDEKEFGGSGYSNKNRNDITNTNQNLSLAPNSIIILKRIG